jgi:hypothetical protein
MHKFDYRGIAALIIALSLGATMILGMIGLIWHGKDLGERGLNAFIAIGSGLAGGVAGYIGGKMSNGKDKHNG